MDFKTLPITELQLNPVTMIGGQWWLITAGNEASGYNTMTASWGHLGSLWERPGARTHQGLATAVVYLRPQRYTKEFMDREDYFTLSVFDGSYKKALTYLGSRSGRDEGKVAATGLTPVFEDSVTYFKQARMVFFCRKLYQAPLLEEGFTDQSLIADNYPKKDFHHMYVGEITRILLKE